MNIYLIRHGESESNVSLDVLRTKPDHLVELTPKGIEQAHTAGEKLVKMLKNEGVMCLYSPFKRAKDTFDIINKYLDENNIEIYATKEDIRIREQDCGNLYKYTPEEIKQIAEEKEKVGRFFYRFPNGESGADIWMRMNNFIDYIEMVNTVNHVNNFVIVSHGTAIKIFLMCFFNWDYRYFDSLYRQENCEILHIKFDFDKREYICTPELKVWKEGM